MYLKTLKLIALIIMLSVAEVGAQSVTSSPYSRYGLGDLAGPGTGHNIAMGGTTAAESTPLFINTANPACNTNLQLQRFVFDVGFDARYTSIKSATESQKTSQTTFKYLAGAFAAKPWWYFSFCLKPYSTMGYDVKDSTKITDKDNNIHAFSESYSGTGGLNKVSISTAFKFLKMFSVGFTGSVLFGNLERTQYLNGVRGGYVINSVSYPFTTQLYTTNKHIVHGLQSDIGFRFEKSVKSKKDTLRDALRVSIGAYIGNKASLKARNELYMRSDYDYYSYSDYYTSSSAVTQSNVIVNDTTSTEDIEIPRGFGVGASVEIAEKLTINADYHTQQWGSFRLPADEARSQMRDSKKMAFGMQFAEAKYSSKYYRTIIYRFGMYKNETYLSLNGHGIDEKGMTFGLGFPIRTLILNVGLDMGKRGTTKDGLLEERYYLLHFNATLHDIWFVKRKFQ